jgi:hypothetical protein
MIHVRVRDEGVRGAQQRAGGQRAQVAEVEQQRAALVAHVHPQPGLVTARVDEVRVEHGAPGDTEQAGRPPCELVAIVRSRLPPSARDLTPGRGSGSCRQP